MTEYEKMQSGQIYDPADSELTLQQFGYLDKLWEFNMLKPSDIDKKNKYMKQMFRQCGTGCYIELPFHANWGGHNVYFGNNIYANFNLTIVDDGNVYVMDNVMFGPNVTIATANHPIEPSLRQRGLQYVKDVYIGTNVWIGANSVIVPGVSIGDNTVVGAGSVVTKNLPENTVCVGNPCHVLRQIGDRDREYFFKNEKINREDYQI